MFLVSEEHLAYRRKVIKKCHHTRRLGGGGGVSGMENEECITGHSPKSELQKGNK
jgi:hypothetical protein